MSMMIPNPQTSAIPQDAAGTINAPPTDDPNLYVDPVQSFGLPTQYMLPSDLGPRLQQGAPMGAFTDAQYLADEAGLRNQISQQYATLLQSLGYQDPSGSGRVIPGRLIQDANIQMAQYQRAMQDAARTAIQNAQQGGTVFSGIRAQQLEQAQYPTSQAMAGLTLNTGRSLEDLYNQATQLAGNYNMQNNQLLAAAAQRQAAALMAAPPSPPTINISYPGAYSPPDTSPPPADTTPPDVQYSGPNVQQPAAVGSPDSPYYYGGGGYSPAYTPPTPTPKPAPVQPSAVGSANSPYYYGGGGTKPRR
jgi:hypothetical protein